jgi:uncharacterized protein (DUF1800 family)
MDEYTSPLTLYEARHLLRRTSFGAKPGEAEALAGRTAAEIVDVILAAATSAPLPKTPTWANDLIPPRSASSEVRAAFAQNNTAWRVELTVDWIQQMAKNRFRERLTLFWHDHFVTSYVDYLYSAWGYRYLNTLRTNAFGNFKDFVRLIGLDAAMLIYLDGNINNGNAPNENYARELMELFTMGPLNRDGIPNYTESDVQEIAKALSGWGLATLENWDVHFSYAAFDDGNKTFFGRTGEFGYDDVIDILFDERAEQIAYFMAKKLVTEFVYRDPNPALISAVSAALLSSNFEIKPALRVLLVSSAFFDSTVISAREKSPADLCIGHYVEMDIVPNDEQAEFVRRAIIPLDQTLLNPPNVAGWPGHRNWITTSTLAARWSTSDLIVRRYSEPDQILAFAESMTPTGSTSPAIDLALALAGHVLAVPLEWVEVAEIEEPFEGDLLNRPLPDWFLNGPAYQRNLVKIFLNGLPWYEWDLSIGGAADRIVQYLIRLSQFPEYQLM